MKRVFFAFALLNAVLLHASANFCSLSSEKQQALIKCSENYKFHQCDQLIEAGTASDLINNCQSPEDTKEVNSLSEAAAFCGKGLKEAIEGIPKAAAAFKDWMFLEGDHNAHIGDYKICDRERSESASIWDSVKWASCIRSSQATNLFKKTKDFVTDKNGERTQAVETIFRSAHCYKKEAYAKTLCPMIAEFAAGVFAGPAIKAVKSVGKSGSKVRGALRSVAAESEDYLGKAAKKTASDAEKKSIAHQGDLLDATKNPALAEIIDRAGLDMKALHQGMLDSDMGKLAHYQDLLKLPSAESDELFNALKGQGEAGKAISEALAVKGFKNTNLVNPGLTNDDLRKMFQFNNALPGYMHELPGIHNAIQDLKAGKISKTEFQKRFLTNFGHNGPAEGFWKTLGENIVPMGMRDARSKEFFANTLYEGKKRGDIVLPKYPPPVTAEGIFHTTMDRLSQGTAGGMDKIFTELGGKPYLENPKAPLGGIGFNVDKGLWNLNEMLIASPKKTLEQLAELKNHTTSLKGLSEVQRTELTKLIEMSEERIKIQNKFVEKNVKVINNADGTIKEIYISAKNEMGLLVKHKIDLNTPTNEAHALMNRLMEQEQKLNGRAIADLGHNPALAAKPRVPIYSTIQCTRALTPEKTGSAR